MKLALAALALTPLAVVAAAVTPVQDDVFSGPLVGEPILGFEAVGMNGELRDQAHDFVAAYAGAPTVYCFVHEVSRATGKTLRALDDACAARAEDGLEALFVLLGSDQDATERYGLSLPGLLEMRSQLAVSADGVEGPGAWGLNKEMSLTVVVAKDDVVVSNHPLLVTNANDVPEIMAAVDEAMLELEDMDDVKREILALRAELREVRAELARLAPPADPGPGMQRMSGEGKAPGRGN